MCRAVFRTNIEEAYLALDRCFRGWNYRPHAGETYAYNCRPITGGSDYSLHSYRDDSTFTFWSGVTVTIAIAVDINSTKNPYGSRLVTDMPRPMVEAVLAIRTNSGAQVWRWGGQYSGNKDAMHYELVCSPAELRTGIDWRTVAVVPNQETEPQEELPVESTVVFNRGDQQNYLFTDDDFIWLDGGSAEVASVSARFGAMSVGSSTFSRLKARVNGRRKSLGLDAKT